jgi:hypothetical protein
LNSNSIFEFGLVGTGTGPDGRNRFPWVRYTLFTASSHLGKLTGAIIETRRLNRRANCLLFLFGSLNILAKKINGKSVFIGAQVQSIMKGNMS